VERGHRHRHLDDSSVDVDVQRATVPPVVRAVEVPGQVGERVEVFDQVRPRDIESLGGLAGLGGLVEDGPEAVVLDVRVRDDRDVLGGRLDARPLEEQVRPVDGAAPGVVDRPAVAGSLRRVRHSPAHVVLLELILRLEVDDHLAVVGGLVRLDERGDRLGVEVGRPLDVEFVRRRADLGQVVGVRSRGGPAVRGGGSVSPGGRAVPVVRRRRRPLATLGRVVADTAGEREDAGSGQREEFASVHVRAVERDG